MKYIHLWIDGELLSDLTLNKIAVARQLEMSDVIKAQEGVEERDFRNGLGFGRCGS
jgi:hypothetical protein